MAGTETRQIERFRDYLLLMGRLQVPRPLADRIDLSGVVQQTVWEATQTKETLEDDDDVRLAWLRTLFANNLRDEIRKSTAGRRDHRREISLLAAFETSSARIDAFLASQSSSPSAKAVRADELARLANALRDLPDDQRQAIEMHHLSGQPLAEVAEQLGRTREATAALLYRALKKLRERLA